MATTVSVSCSTIQTHLASGGVCKHLLLSFKTLFPHPFSVSLSLCLHCLCILRCSQNGQLMGLLMSQVFPEFCCALCYPRSLGGSPCYLTCVQRAQSTAFIAGLSTQRQALLFHISVMSAPGTTPPAGLFWVGNMDFFSLYMSRKLENIKFLFFYFDIIRKCLWGKCGTYLKKLNLIWGE